MIKQKKAIALMIAMLMVMSNFMGLLGNISLAIHENVTVEFSAVSDGDITLSDGHENEQHQIVRRRVEIYSPRSRKW